MHAKIPKNKNEAILSDISEVRNKNRIQELLRISIEKRLTKKNLLLLSNFNSKNIKQNSQKNTKDDETKN
tara:strand:- start:53 stop:262 length:210 start_codon:yes stop_codon:yes gene_type:complete